MEAVVVMVRAVENLAALVEAVATGALLIGLALQVVQEPLGKAIQVAMEIGTVVRVEEAVVALAVLVETVLQL